MPKPGWPSILIFKKISIVKSSDHAYIVCRLELEKISLTFAVVILDFWSTFLVKEKNLNFVKLTKKKSSWIW